jgi:acetolactate synthase-1/2/3 large subunit
MIEAPYQIGQTLKKAFEIPGPVLIGLRVDYRDNHRLFEDVRERLLNSAVDEELKGASRASKLIA